jgi:tRNA nucleotidyltransferase (CCA-adding enzyme)
MKIYLVGGAVRDKLMGILSKDKDYLVVGSTPEEMVRLGYKPIGKDFPVFLHPTTKEEYALARTEKKVGKGYHGFEFYTSPDVTLEEDLSRRDITINAIAEDEEGNIYDPFNGVDDIKNKLIRHVSDAFPEDPLRVLRVARFAALDNKFKVQKETLVLMKKMVESRELRSLSIERVIAEVTKGLESENPDIMIYYLCESGALNEIFPGLYLPLDSTSLIEQQSNNFVSLGKAIKENSKSLTSESKIIMLLIAPYFFRESRSIKTNEEQAHLFKHLKLSSTNHKILKILMNEELNITNFLSLRAEEKLDCLYRTDFYRRPNIIFEVLNIILVFKTTFHHMDLKYFKDIKIFLVLFSDEISQLKSEIDPSSSGEDIKKLIYQERLTLLKKISN